MSGIVFLGAVVAAVYVIYWSYRNDQAGNSGPTSGLLAMRESAAPKAAPQGTSKFRRHEANDGPATLGQ